MSWEAVTAALTGVGALIGLRPASASVLSPGQRARPGWDGSARVTNFRADVVLLPILLLAGFAWWTGRNVHESSTSAPDALCRRSPIICIGYSMLDEPQRDGPH